MEKADKIRYLKLYPQFQTNQRNTNTSIPPQFASKPDSFERSVVKSNDDSIYTDIDKVRDTFKKFITTARTLQQQVNALDDKTAGNKKGKTSLKSRLKAFGIIAPARRIQSVPDKIANDDYFGVAGAIAVAGLLLPEDLRDTKDGLKQVLHIIIPKSVQEKIKVKCPKFYDYLINYVSTPEMKGVQTSFSFVRGSYLEKLVNKFMANKYGHALYERDKTLFDSKLGQKIMNLLGVEEIKKEIHTGRFVDKVIFKYGKYIVGEQEVLAYKLKGPYIGQLICKAMKRITKYGTLALCAIALPSIVKAFIKPEKTKDKLENGGKQTLKAVVGIVSTVSLIGLFGALLNPIGPVGSLAGMAIGSVLAIYVSNKINNNIKTD